MELWCGLLLGELGGMNPEPGICTLSRHPRESGDPWILAGVYPFEIPAGVYPFEIPASTGMTKGTRMTKGAGMTFWL